MVFKNKIDSLKVFGCEKLSKVLLRRFNFFYFLKVNGKLFFNLMDDDFSKDNFL